MGSIRTLGTVAVALASLASGGCVGWFLQGAEQTRRAPASPVATYSVASCAMATGQEIPGPSATYYLANEARGMALYEMSSGSDGARITNQWSDAQGQYFFVWVRGGPGYLYVFPSGGGQPVRQVYVARSYSGQTSGGITRPVGTPAATCPLVAGAGGGWGGDTAGTPANDGWGGEQQAAPANDGWGSPAPTNDGWGAQPTQDGWGGSGSTTATAPTPTPAPTPAPRPTPSVTPTPAATGSASTVARSPQVCAGNDLTTAQTAARRGRAFFEQGSTSRDRQLLQDALSEFDSQCRAGDDWALEWRAAALGALGLSLDAIASLDAFLVLHPESTLPADVRLRVQALRPRLEASVATIVATSATSGATLSVNGSAPLPIDGRAIRLTPGSATLQARLGGRTEGSQIQVAAGQRYTPSFNFPAAVAVAPQPAPQPVVQPAPRPQPAQPQPSATSTGSDDLSYIPPPVMPDAPEPIADESQPGGGGGGPDLIPLIVPSAILGGVSFVLAPILYVVAEERQAYYFFSGCTTSLAIECEAVWSEYRATSDASIAFFVLGGVFTATAIVLGIVQAVSGGSGGSSAFRCDPINGCSYVF